MTTKIKGFKVQEGKTRLTAHDGTTFIYPSFKRGLYVELMEEIDAAGLKRPVLSDIITLAYTAWQTPDEKYSQEIIKLMKNYWLVSDTGILYTREGVYIQDHPATDKNGDLFMSETSLKTKLRAKDKSVRFVKYRHRTKHDNLEFLRRNSFVNALVGKRRQVGLIIKLASKYSDNNIHIESWNKETILAYGNKINIAVLEANGMLSIGSRGVKYCGKNGKRGFTFGVEKTKSK